MYSAAPSSVISDNGTDHSLFVRELLKEICTRPKAEETLNRTRVGASPRPRQRAGSVDLIIIGRGFLLYSRHRPAGVEPATAGEPNRHCYCSCAAPSTAGPNRHCFASPPAPPIQTATAPPAPEPPSPPAPKPVEVVEYSAAGSSGSADQARRQFGRGDAQADDPTIKTLTAAQRQSDDAAALYRRGQVYASKGCLRARHPGFQ